MPQVNNVSPVLPVAAAAPVQGSGNAAASQGSDTQSSFSQMLRDKQTTANNASNSANTSNKADASNAPKTRGKSTDDKADATQKKDSDDSAANAAAAPDSTPKTPAEMAQLLAAAGLMGNATQTPATTTADTPADKSAIDVASKTATDPDALAALPKTDKTAADAAAAAASLAAGTTTTTTTSSAEQALAAQAQSAKLDSKGGQAGTSNSDQQSADKQPLLAVASQADADKTHAAAANPDASFAAALDAANQNANTPVATNVTQTHVTQAPATAHTIATPVGRQGWADEVGQRVLWTAKSDSSRADLVLTPPQLGRIEVSIHMDGDQANANFTVANPVAREALQDAMPKLRELMSQAGIQLGQADVSAGQSGQTGNQGDGRQSGGGGGGNRGRGGILGGDSMIGATTGNWTRQGTGLVDTFA
jgi:flagellar hook-length control protein FliK